MKRLKPPKNGRPRKTEAAMISFKGVDLQPLLKTVKRLLNKLGFKKFSS